MYKWILVYSTKRNPPLQDFLLGQFDPDEKIKADPATTIGD
jgi:hypothetical protein